MPFLKRSRWLNVFLNLIRYLGLYFLAKNRVLHLIKAWSENGLQQKSESEALFKPTYVLGQTK